MGAIFFLVLGTSFLSGVLPGLIFLAVACDIVVFSQGLHEAGTRMVLVFGVLSPALGFYTLGMLLDRAAFPKLPHKIFSTFMLLAGATLPVTPEFLRSLGLLASVQSAQILPILIKLISAVFFCGGLTAAILMFLCLAWELPMIWVSDKFRLRLAEITQSARPIVLGAIFALGINLVLGLFRSEFSLARILKELV